MKRVTITKLKELKDAKHPNNIEVDFTTTIAVNDFMFHKPRVGESFSLRSSHEGFFTSKVTEIISPTKFKTLNSIYSWKVINQ